MSRSRGIQVSRCSFGGGTRACGRLTAWLIVLINLIAFAIQPALGQQRQGLFGNRSRRQSAPRPAILERNAPIENLLRKADSAISRQDWKLAIDSLQRILDDPGGALLRADAPRSDGSAGMTMFESAQDRATLLLASMPTEGIEAYRLLHDGQAKALYKRGVEDCDETALRTILARYMVSSYGDDAGDVVVGWLLDRNRPAEAIELLDRIDRVCKDSDISPARFGVKRAAAWTMLHDQTQAEEALASLSSDGNIDGQEGFDLSALRRFVRGGWPTTLSTSVSAGRESWPVLGGDLRRRFQMPAVTPELLGNLPWRFVLPADHDYPSWWEAFWESSEGETRGYPVGEFVISEGRLFVKSLRQIVALDFESLDPLWVSDRPIVVDREQRRSRQRNRRPPQLELVDSSFNVNDRFMRDHVGGSLSTGFGKVFAIERDGVGKFPQATVGTRAPAPNRFQVYKGTRLVAHDAQYGELIWQRGRSGDPDDPLGSVEFLSAPIAIDDALWVVYAQASDLYLGVLSPDRGKLSHSLLLCTVDPAQLRQRNHLAIYPTSDGSTVYISTGFGVVIAVNIDPFSLRWAAQYEQHTGYNNTLAKQHWLCSPPMMAGSLLLVAPPDSELLLALDRATGNLKWSLGKPPGADYLLGIDDDRIWLGGEQLYCVSLHDGLIEWETQEDNLRATGRGALSGESVFVPTLDGLVVVEASTGQRIEVRQVGDQPPLGNILCIANATISVDPNEVRKFPDLTLSYPKALAFHEEDPSDRQAAIRLAWMELRRGDPRRAFEVLQRVRPPSRREFYGLSDVARLRFEALLGISSLPDVQDDEAIEKLGEAVALAEGGQAHLRAVIGLAFRLRDVGRIDEAYLALWKLGLTASGDGFVTIEPRLRNKVRLVIGEVLSRFERDLNAMQLREIANETQLVAQEAIAELESGATRVAAQNRLNQLAQMNDVGGAGQASLIALARFARDGGQFEIAEQHAMRAIAQDRVVTQTATALRDLAEQYLLASQNMHHDAAVLLDRLEDEFAKYDAIGTDGESVSIRDEVLRLRERVDTERADDGAFMSHPVSFRWKAPIASKFTDRSGDGMFTHVPAQSATFMDHVLFSVPGGMIEAINREDGSLAWKTTLRLLSSSQSPEPDEQVDEMDAFRHPRLVSGGQIAVINGRKGIFAVGIRSGRRLWGAAYEDTATFGRMPLRDRLVAVDSGLMVAALRRGVLICSALSDAHNVQWERILTGEKIDSIFVRDGLCITLDNRRQRATTYDLRSGRIHSSIEFHQPSDGKGPVPVIYENGHLIGPNGEDEVVCYSARSGEENWRRQTTGELRWIFKPGDGYVGVSCHRGGILLIDALAGDIKLDINVPQVAEGFAEGVLLDDQLVLMGMTKTSRGDEPALIGIDTKTSTVLWERSQLGTVGMNRHALWGLLTVAEEVMPIFHRIEVESENPFRQSMGEVGIDLIDKRTGKTIGGTIRTGLMPSENERLTGEFGVWPGQFIVGARRELLSIPLADQTSRPLDTEIVP